MYDRKMKNRPEKANTSGPKSSGWCCSHGMHSRPVISYPTSHTPHSTPVWPVRHTLIPSAVSLSPVRFC
eukprot:1239072-Rhodomonas_salina.1